MKRINQHLLGLLAAAALVAGMTLTGGAATGAAQAAQSTGVDHTKIVVGNIIW